MKIETPLGWYMLGTRVRKTTGASWNGKIVGFYSTDLTPYGYIIESEKEPGNVQEHPFSDIELAE